MKILWIKAGGLVPPDTGGKIRSYHILRELARKHSVTLFTFYAAHAKDQHPALDQIFERVIALPLALPQPKSAGELLSYLRQLFSMQPYNISKYSRPQVRRVLRDLVKRENYDVLVCDFLAAAGVFPWNWPGPKILFTHNVEATIWRRHYEEADNLLWKALSWREWKTMERAERMYLNKADHVLAVSDLDRDSFGKVLEASKISVIPTGVDLEFFRPQPGQENPKSLVFTGSMDWLPNEDAVFYFVQEIFPLIRVQISDVSLYVVGRRPSPKLRALASKEKSIQLTGGVEDVRPYLARAAVCIVPLRIGGGTRIKIFEAMGMAKATVSTFVGAEGLPVQHGKDILLADKPEEFAGHVLSLLRDPEHRCRLGAAGRELVSRNHSWPQIGETLAAVLETVIMTAKSPAGN